jgi:hypothetical protein
MEPSSAMKESLREWLRANTPEGSRLVVRCDGLVIELQVCCSGSDNLMAYACALEPGHAGQCFSKHKQVNFTPIQD